MLNCRPFGVQYIIDLSRVAEQPAQPKVTLTSASLTASIRVSTD